MTTYQTRHLEATREISHGDKFLKPGDRFDASEVDAEHYLKRGHAKVVTAAPAAPAPRAPAPAPARAAPPARAAAPAPRARSAAPAPAPEAAPASAPAEPPAEAGKAWDVTEPIKASDVPSADAAPPPAEG